MQEMPRPQIISTFKFELTKEQSERLGKLAKANKTPVDLIVKKIIVKFLERN